MTSVVDICNLALSHIRAGSINSIDESSLQAQVCKLHYPFSRDFMLRETAWGFARRIKPLSVVTTEIFNWAYAYQYPSDCLKINRMIGEWESLPTADASVVNRLIDRSLLPLTDSRAQIPFEVFNFADNRVIGANQANLRIDFIVKVTNPDLFTPSFTLGLSHLLASNITMPIVGADQGRALRNENLQLYQSFIADAVSQNSNEQYHSPVESEFISIRR